MGKIEKKKILMFVMMYGIIMSLGLVINKTKAVGHGVTIISPTNGSIITEVYRTSIAFTEPSTIRFAFEITNTDGYYELYETYIDGTYDETLMDGDSNHLNIGRYYHSFYYDGQTFLDRYGQGVHTFKLWLYHPYTVTVGFAEGPNPDDDIVWVNGKSYRITEYSVSFTFDPPVLHYVGFWYEGKYKDEWQNHSVDVIVFRDFICSDNARYLTGYIKITGNWKEETDDPGVLFKDIAKEDNSNDIVIIHFSTHGSGNITDNFEGGTRVYYGALLRPSDYSPNPLKLEWGSWYSVCDFVCDLSNANFEAQTIIAIVDTCHAEYFIDGGWDFDVVPDCIPQHVTVLAACEHLEETQLVFSLDPDTLKQYDKNWSLKKKIDYTPGTFIRAVMRAIYNDSLPLDEALSIEVLKKYDYYYRIFGVSTIEVPGKIADNMMHPVYSDFTFTEEFYLYINPNR